MEATLAEVQSQLAAARPSESAAELSTLLRQTRAQLTAMQNGALRAGRESATALKALSKPFLNWAGKAERLSFDVPTLPMFIHERLSTQAILDSVSRHKLSSQGDWVNVFFGHPERSLPEQLMKAYENPNGWQNRMVLGDSLVVMNSMLHYENMGGQVQMAYIDPPYGVKFGSNFQPFVRKRDVTHNDDEGLTREPEMVKAYRDTWELGLHSYLTYLRDRLLLTRELLAESGSVFVQISDENLHHVREVMDEVFGAENFVSCITYITTSGFNSDSLSRSGDYLIWYGKSKADLKYQPLFKSKQLGDVGASEYKYALLPNGDRRSLTSDELTGTQALPEGARVFRYGPLTSSGASPEGSKAFDFNGKSYSPGGNNHWKVSHAGLQKLADQGMLIARDKSLAYYLFLDWYPVEQINNPKFLS